MVKFVRIHAVAKKDGAQILGIVMPKGNTVELDVLETQLFAVKQAVESGEVEIDAEAAAVVAKAVGAPSAPKGEARKVTEAPAPDAPKGDAPHTEGKKK